MCCTYCSMNKLNRSNFSCYSSHSLCIETALATASFIATATTSRIFMLYVVNICTKANSAQVANVLTNCYNLWICEEILGNTNGLQLSLMFYKTSLVTLLLLHPLNGLLFQETNWVSWHQKCEPFWSKRWSGGSGISWTICKSFALRSSQITTPVPHHSFFTGQMPFLPPKQQRQSTEGTS